MKTLETLKAKKHPATKKAEPKAAAQPAQLKPEAPSFGDAAHTPMEQYKAISSLFGKNPGGSELSSI